MDRKLVRTVSGVLDEDLQAVLDRAGLHAGIEEGSVRCAVCDVAVSMHSIGGLFVKGGELRVFCSEPDCYLGAVAATTNTR